MTTALSTRKDYQVITGMIPPGSTVLDLGCGDGELLALLKEQKSCRVAGIEIAENGIYQCVAKGLTVSHTDINSGLKEYPDKMFDYVILNESLQEVINPRDTILEALRVGRHVIVGVPNFCHILARFQLFFLGRVPVTHRLPYEWYNTPNLRFFSLKDFKAFCRLNQVRVTKFKALGVNRFVFLFPNLLAHIGIFLLEK